MKRDAIAFAQHSKGDKYEKYSEDHFGIISLMKWSMKHSDILGYFFIIIIDTDTLYFAVLMPYHS